MHKALHISVNRLHEPILGGRGLASIEASIDAFQRKIDVYIKNSKEILVIVANNSIKSIGTLHPTKKL